MTRRNPRALIPLLLVGIFLIAPAVAAAQQSTTRMGPSTTVPGVLVQAPLNPEFVQHLQTQTPAQAPGMQTPTGRWLGLVPQPIDFSHLKPLALAPSVSATIPTSYDLRNSGKVSSVKDQAQCGSCWTFATYGSLESSLLPGEPRDFSENNLKNTHGFAPTPCSGGNGMMAMAYLARWSGPVNESDDPYQDTDFNSSPQGLAPQKHVQDVVLIAGRGSALNNDALKSALMTYGALYTSMMMDDLNYYNPATSAYYYNGTASTNHGVTLVGWDDNFSSGNFNAPGPAGNGAFLIKNSWGPAWGQSGYFWISYYDTKYAFDQPSYAFSGEALTGYTREYQYDPLGWVSSLGFTGSNIAWYANVFTAEATELLKAVSTYATADNAVYEISVYTGIGTTPTPGTLAASVTGTFATTGYHTVVLPAPAQLTNGQKFSVVVKMTTPNYNYPIPVEYVRAGYSDAAAASPGQSFFSSTGSTWTDATGYTATANVNIKAFAGAAASTFTLQVAKAGNGSGTVTSGDGFINCGSTCSHSYNAATQVILTAAAAGGSTFTGWSGVCNGTGTCSVTMNSNLSVTATFTSSATYTLTVSKTGTGSGTVTSGDGFINCGSTCSHSYSAASQVTLTAAAAGGSTFTGWSGGGCSGKGSCIVTMNSSATVTATFTVAAASTLDPRHRPRGRSPRRGTVAGTAPALAIRMPADSLRLPNQRPTATPLTRSVWAPIALSDLVGLPFRAININIASPTVAPKLDSDTDRETGEDPGTNK